MWECGLKPPTAGRRNRRNQSLLMWECGLKHKYGYSWCGGNWSLLMWECGLKHPDGEVRIKVDVTPYVGVWIETPEYLTG